MQLSGNLTRSIITCVAVILSSQLLFYGILFLSFGFDPLRSMLFGFSTAAFHSLITILLIRMRHLFKTVPEGLTLSKVNIANILTLFRLFALPTVLFLVIEWHTGQPIGVILLVFMSIVFLTDLLDGISSRTAHRVTRIGKLLDSFADYLSLYVLTISFFILQLVPLWLFLLILFRGLLVWTGMAVLVVRKGSVDFKTSFMGKASIFAIMTMYALEVLNYLIPSMISNPLILSTVEFITALIIVASIIDKIIAFTDAARRDRSDHTGNKLNV